MASLSVSDLRLMLTNRSEVYAAVDQLLPSPERLDFLESMRRAASSPHNPSQPRATEIEQLLLQLEHDLNKGL